MGFSRQEYWSGLPFPSPGDLPDPGIRDWAQVSCTVGRCFIILATRKAQGITCKRVRNADLLPLPTESETLELDVRNCISVRLPSGEGNGTPLQYSCLENPRDGGACWAAVYGVAQSWTRLKRLSSSSSKLCREGMRPANIPVYYGDKYWPWWSHI